MSVSARRVLVTGMGIDDPLLDPLRAPALNLEVCRLTQNLTEDLLAKELKDAVAYIHGGWEFASAEALSFADHLRHIAFLGVGYETFVDVEAARRRNVTVTNTPSMACDAVAEFTVGQIINANRGLLQQVGKAVPAWPTGLPAELAERRIGIIGLGSIGTRIAEILSYGFRCKVAYFSRTRKEHEESRLGLTYKQMRELAAWSEILVLMLPGNRATTGLIDREIIGLMPMGSVLINTARPVVVDPLAVADALNMGRLSQVVFDGDYRDTAFAQKLAARFGPERVLVTGHIASQTRQAMERMVKAAVDSVLEVLTGGRPRNIVVGGQR